MLLHRVAAKVGTALRNNQTFHGYKAACGAPIVAAGELVVGSTVAVGPEPHAQCSRCFTQREETHNEVQLPEDPLSAPIYDERGNKIPGKREREDGLGAAVNTHETGLGNSNGLGQYENRPYG